MINNAESKDLALHFLSAILEKNGNNRQHKNLMAIKTLWLACKYHEILGCNVAILTQNFY